MKVVYELTREDIVKAIAEKFGVDVSNVDLHSYIGMAGYGMGEHEVTCVNAKVIVEKE